MNSGVVDCEQFRRRQMREEAGYVGIIDASNASGEIQRLTLRSDTDLVNIR